MDSSSTATDSLLKFVAWLDKNKKRVSLIAGGVVAGVALISIIIYYESQKETRASEALSNVRKPFSPTAPLPPDVAQSYLKVAQDFEGTKAAGRALIEAASLFYTEGNYSNSETQYKRFLNEYPDSPFLAQGMLGLASTLDAEGKTPEALAKYEELRRRFPNDSVINGTKLALARLYEKQNPAEAYKLYNELLATSSQSGIGSEAGIRLADLTEKYPDLAKTNAPPAPVMSLVPQPLKPSATNPMVMTMTNTSGKPSTSLPSAPTKTATGGASPAPLLLKPAPSTNKP